MTGTTPALWAGRDELLLYLDFDGVLHHENVIWSASHGIQLLAPKRYTLFQHAGLLEALLAPYPQINIVLSTSWVRQCGFVVAAERLPPELRSRVIGATFNPAMGLTDFMSLSRGMQIALDASQRQPHNWLALDDDDRDWPESDRHRLIRTHPQQGISAPAVQAQLRTQLARLAAQA